MSTSDTLGDQHRPTHADHTKVNNIASAVSNPGFPWGGVPTPKVDVKSYFLTNSPHKLHGIESIWTGGVPGSSLISANEVWMHATHLVPYNLLLNDKFMQRLINRSCEWMNPYNLMKKYFWCIT